jgi:hypothetical protein
MEGCHCHGDQTRRMFAYLAIIFFGYILRISEVSKKILANFFPRKKLVILFGKIELGYILGDFFTS